MNKRFRAGFILALVAVVLVIAAMVVGYWLNKHRIGAAIGGLSALCAAVGIMLAYFGKPRMPKQENKPEDVDISAE